MAYAGFRQTIGPLLKKKIGRVQGLENLPDQAPFIIAINHEGFLDPLVILRLIYYKYNRAIFFLTAQKMWKLWGEHLAKNWLGMIPLHEDTKEQIGGAVGEAVKFINQGEIFGIFPEGERNGSQTELLRGKTGTARIALATKVPLIPIGINNNTGFRIGAAIKSLIQKDKKIDINIGSVIDISEFYNQPIDKKLLDDVTKKMMKEIGKLCNKEYNY